MNILYKIDMIDKSTEYIKQGSVKGHETRHAATQSHSHPPARYDRSCSTNASIVGMRAVYHDLRHL